MSDDNTEANSLITTDASTFLVVNAQYVKDLSFENPNAPVSLQQKAEPKVEVNVDVRAVNLSENVYEVTLTTAVTGYNDTTKLFIAELAYAGVFTLTGIEKNDIQPYLLKECPRLLFPFSRSIIADVTRDGGFPPLLIQPIDFSHLYTSSQHEPKTENPE
jgi:preprotein translocase subunit SecB